METVFFGLIIFLFMLAIFDLFVGVSNDAVNFLNSAIGAKVATFRTVLIIAAIGVFVGASMSNGMMDIARHGIFLPHHFSFIELLCIFLAVMVTDVILLDAFNTLGMPTSTTVSLVFEMLGGTFILATIKILHDSTGDLTFYDLLNTDKAFSVIMGIFCSVAIAFVVGAIVQWIARVIFTFNYRKNLKYTAGIFGGIATTAILYFAIIKGLKGSTIMTKETGAWIHDNTFMLVVVCFVVTTILMQILHACKVNVFKIVVFLGTFALALAFAGNDLVNFIGVPLAALSAFQDYAANGGGDYAGYMMGALNESAHTPFIYLFGAGVIMVVALATSKKAQNVVKTSVDLSRQDEGDEMFGSSRMARSIVRGANTTGTVVGQCTPRGVTRWINSRFNKDEAILDNGAAFDLVRAAVNLVVAGLLIVVGTSLKLPLSTTYVTFLVAMGTSLADRAWSRESAVFRITGVLNVIGGWFLTAAIAFTACALVCVIMYYGGSIAKLIFVVIAVTVLVRSNFMKKNKDENDYEEQLFRNMAATCDKKECWTLLKEHVTYTQQRMLKFVGTAYEDVTNGFADEDLRTLRRVVKRVNKEKEARKKLRQRELVGMRKLDKDLSLEKNTWFHLAANSGEQMIYCLKRMSEPVKEHVDNNFNPLSNAEVAELMEVRKKVCDLVARSREAARDMDVKKIDALLAEEDNYKDQLSEMRAAQEDHLQDASSQDIKVVLVYLNMLQETEELISALRHYLRALKLFNS